MSKAVADRVLGVIDDCRDEVVEFAADLVRVPTVNPPGSHYAECADVVSRRLAECGFEIDRIVASERPEHSERYPRVNVVGLRRGKSSRPLVHLNGHMDVVPPGQGWTVDPFGGVIREGRLYGRGSADMKAGLAAAVYAAEALRRAGVDLSGSIEVSATADEESGGFAGVAHLAETGRIASDRTDHVIIPEPFGVHRICIGHRGAYWFRINTRGRTAHGSMPFLGVNAIGHMGSILESIRTRLAPALIGRRTEMPVVPPEARHGTINVNSIRGGQSGDEFQTPCVADWCEAVVDRRFLIEEDLDEVKAEIADLLESTGASNPAWDVDISDVLTFPPVQTPSGSPLVRIFERSIESVIGRAADLVASPGTYDHKHVAGIAGVESCLAYGPGTLEQAHQPDEYCALDDLVLATKVIALALLKLVG